jgi:predicted thioesterase
MKPGLKIGQTAEIEVEISDTMLANFDGRPVHNLYSTSALVNQMEWVARKAILPYLEEHEEVMNSYVEVSHLTLSLPGMKVRVKAVVSEIRDKKIVCDIEAFNSRGKIARGSITQSLIEKQWLDRKMKELSIINQLALNSSPHPVIPPDQSKSQEQKW